jgi:hypothetical protein
MNIETKTLLALKFEGAEPRRDSRKHNHRVAVLRKSDWGMELIPQPQLREEAYLRNENRRIHRDALAGQVGHYTRQGKSLGEARRLAREDMANEGAPVTAYAANRPLTFNPFAALALKD